MASTCEEVGMGASTFCLHRIRTSVAPPKDYAAFVHDDPLVTQIGNNRHPPILQLRQFASMEKWARTDHFNGLARPMGFNDQLVLTACYEPTFGMIGLYRDKAFSSHERQLVGLIQPHVAAAWRRVNAIESTGSPGPLRIALGPNLCPLFLSVQVRHVFRAYFLDWHDSSKIPTRLASWVLHSMRELKSMPGSGPLRAFTAESVRGKLFVRCFPDDRPTSVHLVMVEERAEPDFIRLRRAGLTMRECETIHWMAQGKRDQEIAAILGLSPKTVGKHVENTLHKLHAPNRTAAVGAARRWIEEHSGSIGHHFQGTA